MKALIVACAFAAALAQAPTAHAFYPAKPIHLIVPFPPGATADTTARAIAQYLSQALAQPVVVENKPGADGAIAATFVARAAPDGYTLLFAGNTQMLGVPLLRKNPPYDPMRDFVPIAPLVKYAFFLVVHPTVPAQTLPELVAYARSHPGKLNYASGNVNAILAAAQLMSLRNLDMVHVPYKGEPLAIPDLLDGRVQMMFATGAIVAPLVRERRLRALVTLLPQRSSLLADVPTASEAGVPELSVVIWSGLFGPARVPADVVQTLWRETHAVLKKPQLLEQFDRQGLEPSSGTPGEFAAFLKQQLVDWALAARKAGLKAE